MHRDVDPPLQQRLLDLPHEHAAAAELREPAAPVAIAERRDRHTATARPSARSPSPASSAWASASREPRVPSAMDVGVADGQIEELVHRGGEIAPLAVDRAVAQADGRLVQQLAHDRARQPLDELAIAWLSDSQRPS